MNDVNPILIGFMYLLPFVPVSLLALYFYFQRKNREKDFGTALEKIKALIQEVSNGNVICLEKWNDAISGSEESAFILQAHNGFPEDEDFPGIAIIHNVTDDKYYVGQSLSIMTFVYKELSGSGNKDLYVDTQYKDITIQVISMSKDYETLNDLEEEYVARYDAIKI